MAILFAKSSVKFSQIDEYIRSKSPTSQSLIDVCSITSDMFNRTYKQNKCINILDQIEKKMHQFGIKDNLTVFFMSLVLWQNWLDRKMISDETRAVKNSQMFVNALLSNFLILILRQHTNSKLVANDADLTDENLSRKIERCEKSAEILALYEKMTSKVYDEVDLEEFFKIDIKLVHRINEFQTIYYMLGALCKLNESELKMLEPNKFLNGFFCVNYIKMMDMKQDENNNLMDNDYVRINFLINNCSSTATIRQNLNTKIEFCKKLINKTSLEELLKI